MQHRNGAPHVVFRIDSAPRGASILDLPATDEYENGGDNDHYPAAREEEETAAASTAVRLCADSGTALPAHALHKMPHVHLDAELDEPPSPTRAHDTQRRPPPRQRVSPSHSHRLPHPHPSLPQADGLLEDRVGAGDDARQHLLVTHTVAASVRMPPSCASAHRPGSTSTPPTSVEYVRTQTTRLLRRTRTDAPRHRRLSRRTHSAPQTHDGDHLPTASISRGRYSVNPRRAALPGVYRTRLRTTSVPPPPPIPLDDPAHPGGRRPTPVSHRARHARRARKPAREEVDATRGLPNYGDGPGRRCGSTDDARTPAEKDTMRTPRAHDPVAERVKDERVSPAKGPQPRYVAREKAEASV
ncbi:hypothetical protein B0H16DRAFT_1828590 [Mycena metata]|uniref:Uncharacterized protein n=1 Tax=Mycena metata TaxID=1033252 RepID=A0AAD7M6Y7_9AGAR|nr:hypothetical protein B0H16DRAFT_1828590 [Mycena metata]